MKRCAVCQRALISSADEYGIDFSAPVCQTCYLKGFEQDPANEVKRMEADLKTVENEIGFVKYELQWTRDPDERGDMIDHLDELRDLRRRIKREMKALAGVL